MERYVENAEMPSQLVMRKLVAVWPGLWRWMTLYVDRGIDNVHMPMELRKSAKDYFIRTLFIYSTSPGLGVTVPFADIVPFVLRVWVLEHDVASLSFLTYEVNYTSGLLLNACISRADKTALRDFFDGESVSSKLATVALERLRKTTTYTDRQGIVSTTAFTVDFGIIARFSEFGNLKDALLSQGVVIEVTSAYHHLYQSHYQSGSLSCGLPSERRVTISIDPFQTRQWSYLDYTIFEIPTPFSNLAYLLFRCGGHGRDRP